MVEHQPRVDRSCFLGQDCFFVFTTVPARVTALCGRVPSWRGKESACGAGEAGLIPELERSPGGGSGNPLQYSSLENPMDRGAWWATVHGVIKIRT